MDFCYSSAMTINNPRYFKIENHLTAFQMQRTDQMTNDEIIAELHDQGVINCRQITIQQNSQITATHTYVFTSNKLQLPKIKCWISNYSS